MVAKRVSERLPDGSMFEDDRCCKPSEEYREGSEIKLPRLVYSQSTDGWAGTGTC